LRYTRATAARNGRDHDKMRSMPLTKGVTLISTALLGVACSSSQGSRDPVGPSDLAISSVALAGVGGSINADGDILEVDCTSPLLVGVEPSVVDGKLGDFELAPPGGCDGTVDCGFMLLRVDPTLSEAAGSGGQQVTGSAFQVTSISTPILVDLPLELREGVHQLRLELCDGDGAMVLTPDKLPLKAELSIELRTPTEGCSGSTTDQTGGEGGSGGEAGGSDSAGAAGSSAGTFSGDSGSAGAAGA